MATVANPFVLTFGGKPDVFFGRKEIIGSFTDALENRGSAYRTLFLTGKRGMGKTTLISHFISIAESRGWKTFNVHSEHAAEAFFHLLLEYDELSSTVDPSIGVQILGSGATVKGTARTRKKHYSVINLPELLVDACDKAKDKIILAIDEVQKIPAQDVSIICSAFQKASSSGHDVILVCAGLPGSYERIESYDGSTYMQRSKKEFLSFMPADEVIDGYKSAFKKIPHMGVTDEVLEELNEKSYGYPYLVQLLGYYLVDNVKEELSSPRYAIACGERQLTVQDVERAWEAARGIYEQNVLEPAVRRLGAGTIEYLQAMAAVASPTTKMSRTRDIAKRMGKTGQQLSSVRSRLIERGLILADEDNQLTFTIPYMRDYMLSGEFNNEETWEREIILQRRP